MKPEVVAYLKSQKPQIDVLGRWVYLPNARTGSTSITGGPLSDRAIMHQRGPKNWERVWNKIIEPYIDDAVIFTFVRNPWERAVSAWRILQEKGHISQRVSFPAFIGNGGLSNPKYEHFFRPQSASFMEGGTILPEVFIGRHETRQEDWQHIADRIGIASALPHRNATTHEPYWEYYDPEATRIIERFYATEIHVLGYEFTQ